MASDQSFLEAPIEGKLHDKLSALEARFDELERALGDPATQSDRQRFQEILKEHGTTATLVGMFRAYRRATDGLAEAQELSGAGGDPELRELVSALHATPAPVPLSG